MDQYARAGNLRKLVNAGGDSIRTCPYVNGAPFLVDGGLTAAYVTPE
jgi:hypothetical protein